MYLNAPSSVIYVHCSCQVCIDHHCIGCQFTLSGDAGAKQRAGPSVRALLSCNDLQLSMEQKLYEVMELGTRAGWPGQSGVRPLCGDALLFLFTHRGHPDLGGLFAPEVRLLYIPVLLKDFKCGQLLLGVMECSIFPFLARQVYDLDHIF